VNRNPAFVKNCLTLAGLPVQGGAAEHLPGDTDGPDVGEIITSGAFIAFYSSSALANRRAREIARNGEVSRHGKVTVLYVHAPDFPSATDAQRAAIESCV
jgi:hypothetical protein